MAASKLPDKKIYRIPTATSPTCIGPANKWDPRENNAIKPEVYKSELADLNCMQFCFQTRYQQKFQRRDLRFGGPAFYWDSCEYMWPNRNWKNLRWWPLNFERTYLRLQTRYLRYSNSYNSYTSVFWVHQSTGACGNSKTELEVGQSKMAACKHLFEVQRLPSGIFDFRFGRTIFKQFLFHCWTHNKNVRL